MTNNKTIFIEKLREMKKGLFQDAMVKIETINEIAKNFKYTDLKVHNISYYLYQANQKGIITDEQQIDLFDEITHNEYDLFVEWEEENLSYVSRHYIGRTSSFYYNTNWYGSDIDELTIQSLMEGHELQLDDVFGKLEINLYEYLVNNAKIEFDEDTHDECYFDNESEVLESVNEDLDTIMEIVEEAVRVYKYLEEYKQEQNEYENAEYYLKNYLANYSSETITDELFYRLIDGIEKLNTVKEINITGYFTDENNHYYINVVQDAQYTKLQTKITGNHELSEFLIQLILEQLNQKIKNKFN